MILFSVIRAKRCLTSGKKDDQVARIGGRGREGLANLGNARKKTCFYL